MKKVIDVLSKDIIMADLIDKYGVLDFDFEYRMGTPFVDLVRQVTGQQLSLKAASSIWRRVVALVTQINVGNIDAKNLNSTFTPQALFETDNSALREVGLSYNKIAYVKNIAYSVLSGAICFDSLSKLNDEDIISKLTEIKGVGRWTAEMFLMFTLGREDVFSIGDLGLRTAVEKLYGISNRNEIVQFSKQWEPYKSYASLYLWETLNNK